MTPEQEDQLLQMVAAQAAILLDIRNTLIALGETMQQESGPDQEFVDGCQHPDDARVDLSTFGDLNHWQCRICRFDSKATA